MPTLEGHKEDTGADSDEEIDPLTARDIKTTLFLSRMEALGGKRTGKSSSAQGSIVPPSESDFTTLSDIEELSDREEEHFLESLDGEALEKKLTEEVINNTRVLAKDDILKHYSTVTFSERMLELLTKFLTYVRIRGTEYTKVIRVLKVFGEDALVNEEAKLLKKFKVDNFGDLIYDDEVWSKIDRFASFEVEIPHEPTLSSDEADMNWNSKVQIMQKDLAELEKMKSEIDGLKAENRVLDGLFISMRHQMIMFDEFLEKKEEGVKNLINEKEAIGALYDSLRADAQQLGVEHTALEATHQVALTENVAIQQTYGQQ